MLILKFRDIWIKWIDKDRKKSSLFDSTFFIINTNDYDKIKKYLKNLKCMLEYYCK